MAGQAGEGSSLLLRGLSVTQAVGPSRLGYPVAGACSGVGGEAVLRNELDMLGAGCSAPAPAGAPGQRPMKAILWL